jgi:hypothetical protein
MGATNLALEPEPETVLLKDRVPPVILIASEGEDGERAQRRGADLVLPWPLDIDQLRTAVTVTA